MKSIQPSQVIQFKKRESLEELIADRMTRLTDYQDQAYALLYQGIVDKVRTTEAPLGKTLLSETVARQLYRLMAYKDEYEVARLHTQTGFMERIQNSFEGDFKVHYHLAPPIWSKRNSQGELVKKKFGPIMLTGFKVLAKLKGLRGTKLDYFGKTEERQTERALIREYMQHIDQVLGSLSSETHAHAVAVAQVPENIKGYGHVKERNIRAARSLWASFSAE